VVGVLVQLERVVVGVVVGWRVLFDVGVEVMLVLGVVVGGVVVVCESRVMSMSILV
jgi:hypothetical protein